MDRLSAIDASFLAGEKDGAHMHVGAVLVIEGPAPSREEALAHIASRLHLVPRYRQKLAFPPFDVGRRALEAAERPERTAERIREAAEGLGEVVWANLNPAPETPLNVPIGSHRRVWWTQTELGEFKAIKNSLGGTVNDVVLAVVSGALARWLRTRGIRTEGLELRAQVPVSIRTDAARNRLGNR